MENADHIHLVAKLEAKPQRVDELVKAFEAILPVVRREPGCIRYDLHRNREDHTQLVVLETWKDRASFDAHLAAPSFQALKPTLDALLAEPLSLTLLERLA